MVTTNSLAGGGVAREGGELPTSRPPLVARGYLEATL